MFVMLSELIKIKHIIKFKIIQLQKRLFTKRYFYQDSSLMLLFFLFFFSFSPMNPVWDLDFEISFLPQQTLEEISLASSTTNRSADQLLLQGQFWHKDEKWVILSLFSINNSLNTTSPHSCSNMSQYQISGYKPNCTLLIHCKM